MENSGKSMDKSLLIINTLLNSLGINEYSYCDFDEEDFEYIDNSKVQDAIFDFYMDMLKLSTINNQKEQEIFMNLMATKFNISINTLSEKEQEYVKRNIYEVLKEPENDKPKTLEEMEND